MKPHLAIFSIFIFLTIAASGSAESQKNDPPRMAQNLHTTSSECPSDMVEIEGDYCPNEEQVCLYNTDFDGKRKPGPGDLTWACGEFKKPTKCLSPKIHMHYCIDRFEYPNRLGQIPQDWMTWYEAKKAVESIGKRLCTAREWTLAAEGPDMHPLPYGDGFHRIQGICNFDNNIALDVADQSKNPNDKASEKLRSLLVPSGSMPNCVSNYGVHDMAGNIDEWVVNESSNIYTCPPDLIKEKQCMNISYISGLKGGHIWHVRNASRPMTTAHYPGFGWYETGTRGCLDIKR